MDLGAARHSARRLLSNRARESPRTRGASDDKEEVIQQMCSHCIAALVRSDVSLTKGRTS
jgi:hypothetical protein